MSSPQTHWRPDPTWATDALAGLSLPTSDLLHHGRLPVWRHAVTAVALWLFSLFVGMPIIVLTAIFYEAPVVYPVIGMILLMALGVVLPGVLLIRRIKHRKLENTDRSMWTPSDTTVFHGTPGAVGKATQTFGASRAAAGAEGEARTALILDLLAGRVPGMHVFHGLRFPGSHYADIDHVVVYGRRGLIVDSKLLRPDHYELQEIRAKPTDWQIHQAWEANPNFTLEEVDGTQDLSKVIILRHSDGHEMVNSMPGAAASLTTRHTRVDVAIVEHLDGPLDHDAVDDDYLLNATTQLVMDDGRHVDLISPSELLRLIRIRLIDTQPEVQGVTDTDLLDRLNSLTIGEPA